MKQFLKPRERRAASQALPRLGFVQECNIPPPKAKVRLMAPHVSAVAHGHAARGAIAHESWRIAVGEEGLGDLDIRPTWRVGVSCARSGQCTMAAQAADATLSKPT